MTRRDDGSALVEFVLVGVVLLVPLVYLVMFAAHVQRVSFAATGAARDAGRAYVTAGSDAEGRARAALATTVALRGAGVTPPGDVLSIACTPAPCTYTPGSTVTVTVAVDVRLLGLGTVPVRAHHTEHLDCHVRGTPAEETC